MVAMKVAQLDFEPAELPIDSLTEAQRKQFRDTGLIYVDNAFDSDDATVVRDAIWNKLEKIGIASDETIPTQALDKSLVRTALKRTRRIRGLSCLYSERVEQITCDLVGSNDLYPSKPLLLLTFPNVDSESESNIPSSVWHSDTPHLPNSEPGSSGIIVLGFLNEVEEQGGGTMVLAGSHRLMKGSSKPKRSKEVKRYLKRQSEIQDLFHSEAPNRERFLNEGVEMDGVHLKVTECTGISGGAWFVDSSCLHTITPNRLNLPRMMVRGFYATPRLNSYYKELFPGFESKRWSPKEH